MLAALFAFLRSHWQAAGILSSMLVVAGVISFEHMDNRHLRAKLAVCHGENVTLEMSNKALLSSVEEQNFAIAALQSLSRAKKTQAVRALNGTRARVRALGLKAERIKAQPLTGSDCAGMQKLVEDFVK